MRLNEQLVVEGQKCSLIPYSEDLVEVYHQWMENEWLREMTCSERLTLEEEKKMQQSWREDPNKLTFIIAAKTAHVAHAAKMDSNANNTNTGAEAKNINFNSKNVDHNINSKNILIDLVVRDLSNLNSKDDGNAKNDGSDDKNHEGFNFEEAMASKKLVPCGDVNLFGTETYEGKEGKEGKHHGEEEEEKEETFVEIEVMLALPEYRGKGLAKEALLLIMRFARKYLKIHRFRAKILEKNTNSLKLFEGLGFLEQCRKPIFEEIWLVKRFPEEKQEDSG